MGETKRHQCVFLLRGIVRPRKTMSLRSVPEKISDFLLRCHGRSYCDTCIQERLGLKWRQQVQLVTATLAVTATFTREFSRCCSCYGVKQVIHAAQGTNSLSVAPGSWSIPPPAINPGAGQMMSTRKPHNRCSYSQAATKRTAALDRQQEKRKALGSRPDSISERVLAIIQKVLNSDPNSDKCD